MDLKNGVMSAGLRGLQYSGDVMVVPLFLRPHLRQLRRFILSPLYQFLLIGPIFIFLLLMLHLRIWRPRYFPVKGKKVLVVGSGHVLGEQTRTVADYVIGVNGSLNNAVGSLNLSCDALVCDAEMFNSSKRETIRALSIREGWPPEANLEALVTVQSNENKVDTFPGEFLTFNRLFHVNRVARRAISFHMSKSHHVDNWSNTGLTSTGIFAVALAFACGADTVEMAGFSLTFSRDQPTHYYGSPEAVETFPQNKLLKVGGSFPRDHSAADAQLISGLTLGGRRVTCSHPDFKPLISSSSWVKGKASSD